MVPWRSKFDHAVDSYICIVDICIWLCVMRNWGKLVTDYSLPILQPRIRRRMGEWSIVILGFVEVEYLINY